MAVEDLQPGRGKGDFPGGSRKQAKPYQEHPCGCVHGSVRICSAIAANLLCPWWLSVVVSLVLPMLVLLRVLAGIHFQACLLGCHMQELHFCWSRTSLPLFPLGAAFPGLTPWGGGWRS